MGEVDGGVGAGLPRHRRMPPLPPLLQRVRWMGTEQHGTGAWVVVIALEIRPRRAGALPAASGPMLEKMSGTVFFCGEMDRRSKAECGHATFVLSLSNTKC